jgi:antitoxin YefM
MYSNPVHIKEASEMPRQATYTYVRDNLARLLQEVEEHRDVVIINRRGHEDVALIPAGELESLVETAHLLRSPKNAERLLTALRRALARKGKVQTVAELRAQLGLE